MKDSLHTLLYCLRHHAVRAGRLLLLPEITSEC